MAQALVDIAEADAMPVATASPEPTEAFTQPQQPVSATPTEVFAQPQEPQQPATPQEPQQPATPQQPPSNGELDANGFPWDARIHSTGKSRTAKNVWKYLRQPKNFETKEQWLAHIAQVEAELKGAPQEVQQPAPTPQEVQQPVPTPTIADIVTMVTNNPHRITMDSVSGVLNKHGLSDMGQLYGKDDIIVAVKTELEEIINAASA